jgi:hypothetical protein
MDSEVWRVNTVRTKQEAMDELNRELNIRCRCFPRWVKDGRVSATDAQDRIDRLATAIEILATQCPQEVLVRV